MAPLEAIRWHKGPPAHLALLDQRQLPHRSEWLDIDGTEAAFTAIKDMAVRGAPAIAIAAALAMAVELINGGGGGQFADVIEAVTAVSDAMAYLVSSRPTAVNLANAATHLTSLADEEAAAPHATAQQVVARVVTACEAMFADDVAGNQAMGRFGAEGILAELVARGRPAGAVQVLTHCNTGSLATAAYGTALGVVRALHEAGALGHAYCTETRPYNQGSRLTAYELVTEGVPATLIVDSAASALMGAGRVGAVVVGADRVAANGDTANKIGTRALAMLAAAHQIPFYVAAPTTTLDPCKKNGSEIPIEERSPQEITHFRGEHVAAPGIKVWNPGFDITPAHLITGIITERGLLKRQGAAFDIEGFLRQRGQASEHVRALDANGHGPAANGAPDQPDEAPGSLEGAPEGFRALDVDSIVDYLVFKPTLCALVGPPDTRGAWKVREVGDGNINYVYIVEGPVGALVLKQGLPFIRIAQDWPLSQDRARIEAAALAEQARHCPEHCPVLHAFDSAMCLIAMQYLAPPHDILRRALTAGGVFPSLPGHIAQFMARTLFATSLLALNTTEWRAAAARFQNNELCRLTEQVIFTDPYHAAPRNRHTAPHLDAAAAALRADVPSKVAATRLKALLCERAQALLHGDLHTGSIMVTHSSTVVIDPEFAFYGPIAFDVGKMIANLLIAFFAAPGLAAAAGQDRAAQEAWLLQAVVEMWEEFHLEFVSLWTQAVLASKAGDLYPAALYGPAAPGGAAALQAAQERFMDEVLTDALGIAGAVINRRIFGIAHVIDFESIPDAASRAKCEGRALQLARKLLVETLSFRGSIQAVIEEARRVQVAGA